MNWYTPLAILAFSIAFWSYAHAIDRGQWENSDPVVKEWFAHLMMPDQPKTSCCGIADAYWCDIIHVKEGKTFCTITDDQDDRPIGRVHVPIGTEVLIPDYKLTYKDGNPTGHSLVFMSSAGYVFCFVQNGGV
jgi:hypothetical protein